jgi:hypothetical protein
MSMRQRLRRLERLHPPDSPTLWLVCADGEGRVLDDGSAGVLNLERDGKIALGEYAPEAEVVAGKRVYTSVGLCKFPALEFKWTDWYRWCANCNHIQLWDNVQEPTDLQPTCPVCQQMLTGGNLQPRQWI